jgi:hypothetical protein
MMRQGGNWQLREYFRCIKADQLPFTQLYESKGAIHYREQLKSRVQKVLSGEISSIRRSLTPIGWNSHHHNHGDSATGPDCLGNDGDNNGNNSSNNSNSSYVNSANFDELMHAQNIEYLLFTFGVGPIGMTLSRDEKGNACVQRLVSGGNAELNGVCMGDVIVTVAGKKLTEFEDVLQAIRQSPRPLLITVVRTHTANESGGVDESNNSTPMASPRSSRLSPRMSPRYANTQNLQLQLAMSSSSSSSSSSSVFNFANTSTATGMTSGRTSMISLRAAAAALSARKQQPSSSSSLSSFSTSSMDASDGMGSLHPLILVSANTTTNNSPVHTPKTGNSPSDKKMLPPPPVSDVYTHNSSSSSSLGDVTTTLFADVQIGATAHAHTHGDIQLIDSSDPTVDSTVSALSDVLVEDTTTLYVSGSSCETSPNSHSNDHKHMNNNSTIEQTHIQANATDTLTNTDADKYRTFSKESTDSLDIDSGRDILSEYGVDSGRSSNNNSDNAILMLTSEHILHVHTHTSSTGAVVGPDDSVLMTDMSAILDSGRSGDSSGRDHIPVPEVETKLALEDIAFLHVGTEIRVWKKGKWRHAMCRRLNKDGTFEVSCCWTTDGSNYLCFFVICM